MFRVLADPGGPLNACTCVFHKSNVDGLTRDSCPRTVVDISECRCNNAEPFLGTSCHGMDMMRRNPRQGQPTGGRLNLSKYTGIDVHGLRNLTVLRNPKYALQVFATTTWWIARIQIGTWRPRHRLVLFLTAHAKFGCTVYSASHRVYQFGRMIYIISKHKTLQAHLHADQNRPPIYYVTICT